jgi:glycosyltransferase involved in cell wall biosynthesis
VRIRQLVCTDAFAGVERYVTYVAVELARRGHEVEVIGGEPARMRAALDPAGVSHVAVASVSAVTRAAVRRPRPDLVHAHMTAADTAAVLGRPVVRRPVVSTLHFAHRRGHSPTTRTLYKALRPFITTEVAISQYVATAAGGGPVVIPNGIPAAPAPSASGREPIVLMVQRLEREKDTATAVRAWQVAGLRQAGWSLQLLGAGAEREALESLVRELGLGDSVDLVGSVDDVGDRMRRASLLLATAPAEPFGLAVVEAMAAGLPVVAADGGAHRETIGPASPGTLFPPGDAAAAARILDELGADPERRADLAAAGRARFEAEYTIETHVDRLEALYRRLVG